jgi:hypothetical protein
MGATINGERLRIVASAALIAGFLSACATAGGMRNAPLDAGVQRAFSSDYGTVVAAARSSVTEAGLALDAVDIPDSNTTLILGRVDAHSVGWGATTSGAYARVVIIRSAPNETIVRILSKRKVAFNVGRGDYSETIFSLIASRLPPRKSGA